MSLIALSERLHASRHLARTLLMLIAVTSAVIAGLLAMHSLNMHSTAGHAETHAAVEHGDSMMVPTDGHTDQDAATECVDCGKGGSSGMLAMACVLALLVTLFVLGRVASFRRLLATLPRPQPPHTWARAQVFSSPSLAALCISRT